MYATFTSGRRGKVRNFRPTTNLPISNSDNIKTLSDERVDKLCSMVIKANTTSILNTLEEHRKNLSKTSFRSLILSLTTKFNDSTWLENSQTQTVYRKRFKKNLLSKADIDQCILIVLYYIVSVINKYQINGVNSIWTEILNNSVTKTMKFYRFLYKNKIVLPDKICEVFSDKIASFYTYGSSDDNIKLILLGFSLNMTITRFSQSGSYLKIKDCEKLFAEVKQQQLFNKNLKLQQLIVLMKTPEELSLFLSYFSDYDLNSIASNTDHNVLDQIIHMNPYFYVLPQVEGDANQAAHPFSSIGVLRPRRNDGSKLDSYPNEITKYRTTRLLNLFRTVILQGGKLSQPTFNNLTPRMIGENRFFTTSIGIYALIGLRMDDICPSESSWERDTMFISNIIKLLKRFPSEFEAFILHHLASSYSIIHKKEFIEQKRRNENIQAQDINDKLFQQTLTLKEWCRLKIKDICPQKTISQLNLSKSLTDYCSFGLLSSNYATKCIKEVTKYNGNIMPNNSSLTHVLPQIDDSDYEQVLDDIYATDNDDEDNSGVSVNSFDQSDEN